MFLLDTLARKGKRKRGGSVVIGHVNYGSRGTDSEMDEAAVVSIGERLGMESVVMKRAIAPIPPAFEEKARDIRYAFLTDLASRRGARTILVAHTADDQVETILMRVFKGAGVAGLKGIPREGEEGIARPIIDIWKEDIVKSLKKRKISYRIDRSNLDLRYERNWVRHLIIPLLEERYGKSVKKRILALGERFREIDEYLEAETGRWIRKNLPGNGEIRFRRKAYEKLPAILRMKILQGICFGKLAIAANERLLKAMDRNLLEGGASARMDIGKRWVLANSYEWSCFRKKEAGEGRNKAVHRERIIPPLVMKTPGRYEIPFDAKGENRILTWSAKGKVSPSNARRLGEGSNAELFDVGALRLPLVVRPLGPGDRIRPFGSSAGKKVKEILIDRKVPRGDRWGRPAICDANGEILWIPGVVRSASAPVTALTVKCALLRIRSRE